MLMTGSLPGINPLLADVTANKLMPKCQRSFRSLTFVTGTDSGTFVIVHQGKVDCAGHRALLKFNGRAYID
jgi:hypothetical protein